MSWLIAIHSDGNTVGSHTSGISVEEAIKQMQAVIKDYRKELLEEQLAKGGSNGRHGVQTPKRERAKGTG